MIHISQAVASLRPGVEWTMNGDDVEGIIWHTEGVQPLTRKEVEAEVKRLEKAAAKAEADRVAARESAVAKLAALGLDANEVAALLGGTA